MLHPTSSTPTHNSTHDPDLTQTPLHHPDTSFEWELLVFRADLIREALKEHELLEIHPSSRVYEVLFTYLMCMYEEAAEYQHPPIPPPVHHPLTQPHHQYTPLPHSQPTLFLPTPHISYRTYRHTPTSP
ncbi:hypothetical protein Pcinc_017563 [Petrolisthes cinctipes]|uniref:Uncharacterized protein n=1 Tax=Petrolisthes cinctipes TaxID=88211 RepID=A0AAE1FQ14_PETCI|nr:hypothetical protein Pcinc_017563 [Petrolisthes cinctipes]